VEEVLAVLLTELQSQHRKFNTHKAAAAVVAAAARGHLSRIFISQMLRIQSASAQVAQEEQAFHTRRELELPQLELQSSAALAALVVQLHSELLSRQAAAAAGQVAAHERIQRSTA